MTHLELRQRMDRVKALKLECIRKRDFLNAAMYHNHFNFYHRKWSQQVAGILFT